MQEIHEPATRLNARIWRSRTLLGLKFAAIDLRTVRARPGFAGMPS